jgi:hypothetical protein
VMILALGIILGFTDIFSLFSLFDAYGEIVDGLEDDKEGRGDCILIIL